MITSADKELHADIVRLAGLGWRLHPSSRSSRSACFKGASDAATNDLTTLAAWAADYPRSNWRVVMAGSDVWAIDVDAPGATHEADGISALAALVAKHGPLPPRPMIRTGGGGLVLFFKDNGERIVGKTGTPAPGIDPRRGKLSVTVPPSIHPDTFRLYRWIVPPWELTPPTAPAWLVRLLAPPPEAPAPAAPFLRPDGEHGRSYAIGALRRAVSEVATAPAGARNDTLNRAAWSVARFIPKGTLSPSEIAQSLAVAARIAGLDHNETARTLASALAKGTQR